MLRKIYMRKPWYSFIYLSGASTVVMPTARSEPSPSLFPTSWPFAPGAPTDLQPHSVQSALR